MRIVENGRFIPEFEMRLRHLGFVYNEEGFKGSSQYCHKDNVNVYADEDGSYSVQITLISQDSIHERWYEFATNYCVQFNKAIKLVADVCRVIGEFERREK